MSLKPSTMLHLLIWMRKWVTECWLGARLGMALLGIFLGCWTTSWYGLFNKQSIEMIFAYAYIIWFLSSALNINVKKFIKLLMRKHGIFPLSLNYLVNLQPRGWVWISGWRNSSNYWCECMGYSHCHFQLSCELTTMGMSLDKWVLACWQK